jgi:diguanylate cyclase (GGDEF)-like protein
VFEIVIPVSGDSVSQSPSEPDGNDVQANTVKRQSEDLDPLRDAIVMMVDDEPINLEVTQIYLEDAGYSRFVSTDNPKKALALLADERPDLLLLDLMMPGMSGLDILREMQSKNILKDLPTIVLTSSDDAQVKLDALELGATDFLSKPVDASELALRVRNTLAAKAYRDRLANYDRLTGLPNRRTFVDRLEWSLRNSQRYKKDGAVLSIELDGFKQINDALGPAIGDQLLQVVAERISNCVRAIDTLGRLESKDSQPSLSRMAGDEFTVLLPVLNRPDSAAVVAQRLLDAIASPVTLSGSEMQITCSIGIATFPGDGTDTDSVIRNAGVAMHHAKREKKHSCQFYSNELNNRALHRLNLANELRRAIARDDLRLFYQPKNDVKTGAVCGCEALVRWQHADRGLVSPGEFIPLAEETGLIVPLGEWVMNTACVQSKAWLSAGLPALKISVNVSSQQFGEGHLVETLRAILADTGAEASALIVEITEGVLMQNAEANIKVLEELNSMGIKLSMDDFGTGYSSLSYLNSFPLDELKIDRSFVMQIKESGDHSPIIKAIIAMAHSLGLKVVAEGVELPQQLEFLRSQRCDEYQGFIVSKPVPPDEFAARFLAASENSG